MKKGDTPDKRVARLKQRLFAANEMEDKTLFHKLWEQLERLNPWDDLFHAGCQGWPFCDIEGCGTDTDVGHRG